MITETADSFIEKFSHPEAKDYFAGPAAQFLRHLKEIDFLPDQHIYEPEERFVCLWKTQLPDVLLTADVEFETDGAAASFIPYWKEDDTSWAPDSEGPISIKIWEIEEPVPFELTLAHIKELLLLK